MNDISLITFKNFLESPKYNELKKDYFDLLDREKIKITALTLRKIRQEKKLSQKELGEKLNKKQNTILKYELGLSKINYKIWSDIIKIFDINYNEFSNTIDQVKHDRQFTKEDNYYTLIEKISGVLINDMNEITKQKFINLKDEIFDDLINLFYDFESDRIEDFTKVLLKKMYPFYIIQNNNIEIPQYKIVSLIENVKIQIENIEDTEKKELGLKKLKKIEKDIENYTIFLLKQNGFID